MVTVARVLGALCLIFAVVVTAFGVWVFVEGSSASTAYEEFDDFSQVAALSYLFASLATALVLATIGATAIVAANAAGHLAEDRYRPAQRPQPAYVAPTPSYGAAAYGPPSQWPPPPTPPAESS